MYDYYSVYYINLKQNEAQSALAGSTRKGLTGLALLKYLYLCYVFRAPVNSLVLILRITRFYDLLSIRVMYDYMM